jgi:hypothetical protein
MGGYLDLPLASVNTLNRNFLTEAGSETELAF